MLAPSAPPLIDAGDELADGGGRCMPASGILDRRRELLSDLLAELDAPLVEGVDPPHDALGQYVVLVERDEATESRWIELPEEHDRAGTAAGIDLVRDQRGDPVRGLSFALELRAHGIGGLPIGECLGLRKATGDSQVLLLLVTARGARRDQEIECRSRRALV